MGLPMKLGVAGVLICVSSVALGWGILPKFIENKVSQSKNLAPGSDGRKIWEKLPFPVIFKMHVFNVTNVHDVNNGDTPMLDEIGPYYFDEWKEKVDLEDDDENDTVSFNMKNTWIFNKEKSFPLTGNEIVYIPHPALMGVILAAERLKPIFLPIVAKSLKGIFNNPTDIFLKSKVMDLLFDGNLLNCTGEKFPDIAVCMMMKKKGIFPEVEPNIFKFSIFGQRNATKEGGRYKVRRGTRDIQELGQMVTYNGSSKQTVWGGEFCNSINGTDGTIFPPFISTQPLYTFASDLCRTMKAKFEKLSTYKAIPTLHYSANFGDMSWNDDEKCFCPAPDKCMKKGVMDLLKCQGVPLIASLPHFYNAHEDYQIGVRGLRPEKSKHDIEIDIEAFTGTPLLAKTRVQFSFPIHKINKVNITANLTETILPFIWIEEGIELSDVILEELDHKLFSVLRSINIGKWVMTGAGAGVSLLGAGLNYINPFGPKYILPVT